MPVVAGKGAVLWLSENVLKNNNIRLASDRWTDDCACSILKTAWFHPIHPTKTNHAPGLPTRVCHIRRDQMVLGPTESHRGCNWFRLRSGVPAVDIAERRTLDGCRTLVSA